MLQYTMMLFVLFTAAIGLSQAQEPLPQPTNHPATTLVAQVRVTATPIRVELPTQRSISATEIMLATPTPTFTPTEIGPLLIEVPADTSEINVRAEPDPESQRLGVIQADERYPVTGRYFSWLRIEYDASPSGIGWIFGQLVNILGDDTQIPDIDPYSSGGESTVEIVPSSSDSTPDPNNPQVVLITPTEDTRQIIVPTNVNGTEGGLLTLDDERLPTFTPPAENFSPDTIIFSQNATPLPDDSLESEIEASLSNIIDQGLPPIVPIALLGGFGLLGIAVVVLRS